MSFKACEVPRSLAEQESGIPLNNPARRANVVSRLLTQSWLNGLFRKGNKDGLDESDIYDVLPEDATQYMADKLESYWDKEDRTKRTPSLFIPFVKFFGFNYAFNLVYMFFTEGCRLVQPIYIGKFVGYFTTEREKGNWEAYMYASIIVACSLGVAISNHPMFLGMMRAGMHLRVATAALIYRKTLRMSHDTISKVTTGKIVNLITNDVQKLDQVAFFLLYLIVAPFLVIAASYLCWQELHLSFLPGTILLLLLVPFQAWIGRFFATLKFATSTLTDERIGIMNEVIGAMRVVKMYTWENSFDDVISAVRKKESDKIKETSRYRALNASMFIVAIPVMSFAMFLTYVLTDHTLTTEKVFTVIGIFSSIHVVMTTFVPSSIMFLREGAVCMKRIQEFLMLDTGTTPKLSDTGEEPRDLIVRNINASWNKDRGKTLNQVSFKVSPGELLMVIGPVGSGKSSLLLALLREFPLTSGEIRISRSVAYVSQCAWVFSGTVKENILFGQPFDKHKYSRVIKACALDKDLKELAKGDQTLIGERGVTLSGGQRARVDLARAVYFDANVYILDDPLSAVDSVVAKHIFDKCIRGILKSKICVLVSHQLQFMKSSDRILCLNEGKVVGYGDLHYLMQTGVDVLSLMMTGDEQEKLSNTDDMFVEKENEAVQFTLSSKRNVELQRSHSTPPRERMTNKQVVEMYMERGVKSPPNRRSWQPVAIGAYTPQRNRRFKNKQDRQSLYIASSDSHCSLHDQESFHNLSIPAASNLAIQTAGLPIINNFSGHLLHTVFPIRTRTSSVLSSGSISIFHGEPETVVEDLEDNAKEEHFKGKVSLNVYKEYISSGANVVFALFAFTIFLVCQACVLFSDWWLARWADMQSTERNRSNNNDDQNRNMAIYGGLIAICILLSFTRALLFFYILINASQHLHNKMFAAILKAPIYFFDTNPVGRILNRFSKDIGFMDDMLPETFFNAAQLVVFTISTIILSIISMPYLLIIVIPVILVFIWFRQYYVKTAREIKRLEAMNRSPMYSHVSATLQGLTTIRAVKAESQFLTNYNKYQDRHTSTWFLMLTGVRWLGFRLDMLCLLFFAVVVFAPLVANELGISVSASLVGLALIYTKQLTGMFQYCVRQTAEVESQMVSVERVLEYCDIQPEPESKVKEIDPAFDGDWPKYGIISGEKLCFAYHPTSPMVLDNLYFCIRAKEKVGIVGRTGAGKSSLMAALFRLAEPEGVIRIDGVCITEVPLAYLRSKLSVIPQDPVIFAGSIKMNVDPFSKYSDQEIWTTLEEVQMKDVIESFPEKLDSLLSECGGNLSVGQRQLICLARAILKKNRVLIVDEATANVDHQTDNLIQETLRSKFHDCTVLTIAHRLNTIMDSDRVMVLHQGRLVEFDEPYELLQKPTSMFSELVRDAGGSSSEDLYQMARKAREMRMK